MSSVQPTFEEFARDCVRLAEQADTRSFVRNCSAWLASGCRP